MCNYVRACLPRWVKADGGENCQCISQKECVYILVTIIVNIKGRTKNRKKLCASGISIL